MAETSVKYYTSSMTGAPQLTNAWGDLVTLLDACLVDGFNLKTVSSIARVGAVAVATVSSGHGYLADQVIVIAGADQSEYNGEQRIIEITSNTFTFAVVGAPTTPATGTLSAKVAPLNFEKAFTGTSKRAYRSKNVMSNRPYLRVDNSLDPSYTTTYAKKGKVTMAEGMSDIDTFVGARAPFDPANPTKNEIGTGSGTNAVDGWAKWYYARTYGPSVSDSIASETFNRSWVLVGDDRGFYLFNQQSSMSGPSNRGMVGFTDFSSYRAGDAFSSLLMSCEFPQTADRPIYYATGAPWVGLGNALGCTGFVANDVFGKRLMRDDTQVGGNVLASFVSLGTIGSQVISGGSTGVPWPNRPDYSLLLHPVYLQQQDGNLRGKMPGVMFIHNNNPYSDLAVVENVQGYPGRKFLLVDVGGATSSSGNYAQARLAFDITGPWY